MSRVVAGDRSVPFYRSIYIPQVPWYTVSRCTTEDGRIIEEDIGDLCWVCGQALDVFCMENRDDLITNYQGDIGGWRQKVDLVRKGVEAGSYQKHKEQEVASTKALEIKVTLEVGLVTLQVFEAHFGVAAQKIVGIKVVSMLGPENTTLIGILMSASQIPPELPHYKVQMSSISQRSLKDILVNPTNIVWKDQCGDRYNYTCGKMVNGRDPGLKGNNALTLPDYEAMRLAAKATKRHQRNSTDGVAMVSFQPPPPKKTPHCLLEPNMLSHICFSTRFGAAFPLTAHASLQSKRFRTA